jgi:putative ABC transport system permease protein
MELSGSAEGSLQNPDRVSAARLTAGLFPTLGVSPLMGRVFTEKEDENQQPVVVLSYQTWRGRFHCDTGILGRTILLDRKPYEDIGVMPREFEVPLVPCRLNRDQLWIPMSFTQAELVRGAGNWGLSPGRQ